MVSKTNSISINRLSWDSNFFKKNIGSVYIKDSNVTFKNIEDYDLIYVISDVDYQFELNNYKNSFSEIKLLFSKTIKNINDVNNIEGEIIINPAMKPNDEIYSLAIKSGTFSRFNLDKNFKNYDFERLYIKWIDKSFDLKEKEEIIIYKEKEKILGFIGFITNKIEAKVTLLVVECEYRSKGIATKLLKTLENYLFKKNIKLLKIPTQKVNKNACNFYLKNGFKITERKYLKHYWNNDSF